MAFFTFPLQFLQASISALIVCSIAWIVLRVACRCCPGLATRRAPWLLAQLAGGATLVLVLLPGATRSNSAINVPVPMFATAIDNTVFADPGTDDLSGSDLPAVLAWSWLALYGAGVVWHAVRWGRARHAVRALLDAAERRDDTASLPVLETHAPVSPMLIGLLCPVLLLPRHARSLPPEQQQLILVHELTHLRRRDHLWQHAGLLLRVLLWCIPPVHGLYRRLQWAIETGCDRAVLAGRTTVERRSYAAALVAQLALQVRGADDASLAFGAQPVADRIRLIRDGDKVAPARLAGAAVVLLLPALCGASVLLQPHFTWDVAAPMQATVPALAWQAPLQQLHVNSPFGATNRRGGRPHGGLDLRARRGTDVLAPAVGRVTVSTDEYAGGARYGKVIVIDHPDGTRTLYAHLDRRLVQAGDTVGAGQRIALSGATGEVTGPHLHFEMARNGANIDPLALLPSH